MIKDINNYNNSLDNKNKSICKILSNLIDKNLLEAKNKIWHGQPVWFLEGNPIVGYAQRKDCVQLLFWSGQSFDELELQPTGKFKAAEKRYTSTEEINEKNLQRWLQKSKSIQWDYKNIVKRRGNLKKLK